jgi:hypothetical protein
MGLDAAGTAALETLLLDQAEVMRPGFVRLSLPYFASDAEVNYSLAAVHAVAEHGWRQGLTLVHFSPQPKILGSVSRNVQFVTSCDPSILSHAAETTQHLTKSAYAKLRSGRV